MTHVLTRENLRPLADTIVQQLIQTNTDAGVRLDAARSELQQVECQIDNLLRAIEDMGLSPSLREKLTKREADRERLCTEVLRLEKMIVKARDIPRITDEMIDDWLAYIRTALLSSEFNDRQPTPIYRRDARNLHTNFQFIHLCTHRDWLIECGFQ